MGQNSGNGAMRPQTSVRPLITDLALDTTCSSTGTPKEVGQGRSIPVSGEDLAGVLGTGVFKSNRVMESPYKYGDTELLPRTELVGSTTETWVNPLGSPDMEIRS